MNIRKISFEYINKRFYMIIYHDDLSKKLFRVSEACKVELFNLFLDIELRLK